MGAQWPQAEYRSGVIGVKVAFGGKRKENQRSTPLNFQKKELFS